VFIAALLFAIIANMTFLYVAAIKRAFGRREGAAMLALFAVYIITIFFLQLNEVSPLV